MTLDQSDQYGFGSLYLLQSIFCWFVRVSIEGRRLFFCAAIISHIVPFVTENIKFLPQKFPALFFQIRLILNKKFTLWRPKSETGPEGWLQIQHPRLNIEFFRNLSFRQSIQRSSPIVDHYYPLRWSVPISACPLTASDAGCTSDVPITWVLDLALYRYYSIDARCSQFVPASRMSMGNFFENIFLVFCVFSIICQVYDMFQHFRLGDYGIYLLARTIAYQCDSDGTESAHCQKNEADEYQWTGREGRCGSGIHWPYWVQHKKTQPDSAFQYRRGSGGISGLPDRPYREFQRCVVPWVRRS